MPFPKFENFFLLITSSPALLFPAAFLPGLEAGKIARIYIPSPFLTLTILPLCIIMEYGKLYR